MADEKDELQAEVLEAAEKKGGSKKILIIIIAAVVVVLGGGGFLGYKLLASKGEEPEVKEEVRSTSKSVIVALDPFVLNLSDRGRYLKVTLQFEITESSLQSVVKDKTPQLRDTIITLVSSKSLNSISSPEGKFQLKDEVLFRANQIMGMDKDIFKNLFFTEFVMQ